MYDPRNRLTLMSEQLKEYLRQSLPTVIPMQYLPGGSAKLWLAATE